MPLAATLKVEACRRAGGVGDEKLAVGIDLHRQRAGAGIDHGIDIAEAADMQRMTGAGAEIDQRGRGHEAPSPPCRTGWTAPRSHNWWRC